MITATIQETLNLPQRIHISLDDGNKHVQKYGTDVLQSTGNV